jgi:hypothetical protein
VDAGDRLDERRLAGPVVAYEGDHLTGSHLEVDVLERLYRAEALADLLQREYRRSVVHWTPASLHAAAY